MPGADRHLEEHEPSRRPIFGIALTAAVAAVLFVGLLRVPREGAPLPGVARLALRQALGYWHTTEPVNEVVYGSRGFDTFGETFLLLAAVVGVATIARGRQRGRGFIGEDVAAAREQRSVGEGNGAAQVRRAAEDAERGEEGKMARPRLPDAVPLGRSGPETARAMTVVVRSAVRVVGPFLAVAGAYLVAWGYSPGGGFPGGAVLLGVVLLAYVAYGYERVEPLIRPDPLEAVELAGALAIMTIEMLGLVLRGSFSANWLPLAPVGTIRSGGILQPFSAGEMVEVATGLGLAVFALLGMGDDWSARGDPHDDVDPDPSSGPPR